jgi:hypothetical protein
MSERGDSYRLKATEAEEWARLANDQGVRKHFEDLALHFRDLAKTIEGRGILIDFALPIVKH